MRYLIIDACNVFYATNWLRERMRGNLDPARDALVERIRSIHEAEGVHIVLVLDSAGKNLQCEQAAGNARIEFLYAPAEQSADAVIERLVARIGNAAEAAVVSNDRMVRESIRANGALALRPDELFSWADACSRRLAQTLRQRAAANAKAFRNGIDLDI